MLIAPSIRPDVWLAFGYPFEAGSMMAALTACLMVRISFTIQSQRTKIWKWLKEITTINVAMLFTAGWIIIERPDPFYAVLAGTGFGALGMGAIPVSLYWLKRLTIFQKLQASVSNDRRSAPARTETREIK